MTRPAPEPALHDTLIRAAEVLNGAGIRWMLIGGAAMVLHGLKDQTPADIDIVLSAGPAAALGARQGWANHADAGSGRFRSACLLRPDLGPIPVELLGGFQIHTPGGWVAVEPEGGAIQECCIGPQTAFLPAPARLAEIFRLCNRAKDLRRAARLASLN